VATGVRLSILALVRVLVITGAGISAESGIPTFRGKDGYWRNRDPMTLATPEAFARDPVLVWEWYRERRERIRAARPNAAHETIVKLAEHAGEFLLVTQNVDDLHARAGLPPEKMVQIHGDIFVTKCTRCDCRAERGDAARGGTGLDGARPCASGDNIPRCDKCGAMMRPGVVWFGEQLDHRKIDVVEQFLRRGDVDLTIVVGTSALFGYIVDWATRGRRLIEINPDETPLTRLATESIREPAAIALPRLFDSLSAELQR
jgi:NAD-dependent deacetylase